MANRAPILLLSFMGVSSINITVTAPRRCNWYRTVSSRVRLCVQVPFNLDGEYRHVEMSEAMEIRLESTGRSSEAQPSIAHRQQGAGEEKCGSLDVIGLSRGRQEFGGMTESQGKGVRTGRGMW